MKDDTKNHSLCVGHGLYPDLSFPLLQYTLFIAELHQLFGC